MLVWSFIYGDYLINDFEIVCQWVWIHLQMNDFFWEMNICDEYFRCETGEYMKEIPVIGGASALVNLKISY